MEFYKYVMFLKILTIGFRTVNGINDCSSFSNDALNSTGQDGDCDIQRVNRKVSFIFDIGDKATIDCIISTNNDSYIYWLKDGAIIAKNHEATSSKYTVHFPVKSKNVSCNSDPYSLEFVAGVGDSGYYECGCQYLNATSRQGFRVSVDMEPSESSLIGGSITIMTYIITGCFHIAAIITLIVFAVQVRNDCPVGLVCRPARLMIIVIGEVIVMVAVLVVPVLQILKIIPSCCQADLFLKLVGVAVVLFGIGIIIIIITVFVYRKTKVDRKTRTESITSRLDSQEATVDAVPLSGVAQSREQEVILELPPQHSAPDPDRPPPTAPLHSQEDDTLLPQAPPLDHEPLPGQVCCVCCDAPVQVCLPQCGHANLCHSCASQIVTGRKLCPVCNEPATILSILYT